MRTIRHTWRTAFVQFVIPTVVATALYVSRLSAMQQARREA
ncbi:hypothetical protein [Streptomyces sp. NPDC007083]